MDMISVVGPYATWPFIVLAGLVAIIGLLGIAVGGAGSDTDPNRKQGVGLFLVGGLLSIIFIDVLYPALLPESAVVEFFTGLGFILFAICGFAGIILASIGIAAPFIALFSGEKSLGEALIIGGIGVIFGGMVFFMSAYALNGYEGL